MPRFLSAALILNLVLATGGWGQAFTPINSAAAPSRPTTEADGQRLVAESARRLFLEAAIAAELRYKIDAFGHELVGTGRYLQLGTGADKLLRLELKMQVADKPATLQEICDPKYYWVRRELPPAPPTLGRVNLQSLRQTLARTGFDSPQEILPTDNWIMLGGLPRLLAALDKNFAFGPARAEELPYTAANGDIKRLAIWVVDGQWKPECLAAITGRSADKWKAGALPAQLPDRVQLVLGRNKDVLPLFPYRVTYLKLPPQEAADTTVGGAGQGSAPSPPGQKSPAAESEAAPRELLKLELFNVNPQPEIDAREFDYHPAGLQIQDLTTAYLQRYSSEHKTR